MLSETAIRIQPLPRIVFGVGSSADIAKHIGVAGRGDVLIVTDKGIVQAGIVETIAKSLDDAGIKAQVFDGVDPNPTDNNVAAGVEALNAVNDAIVLAVGGGSSMDAAKAIALMGPNGGAVQEYGYGCKPEKPGRPVVAVPTTAGTGSETNLVSVITDSKAGRKLYVAHPSVQPVVAILDPNLTLGLPQYATATCGFDVLTHAIEAFTSRGANPYVDAVATEAIQMAWDFLPATYEDGSNLEARSQMLLASAMAAIAFNVGGLGAAHSTGHPLSARFHTAHGQTLATMLPHVMNFNLEVRESKYAKVAAIMGVADAGRSDTENARACISAIEDLSTKLGLKKSLRDLGAQESDIAQLVEDALADLTMRTNPRKMGPEDATAVYEAALG